MKKTITRAAKLDAAFRSGGLSAAYGMLDQTQKNYTRHLVARYGYQVRAAIERAYVHGYDAWPYDHHMRAAVRETAQPEDFGPWTPPKKQRYYYAIYRPYGVRMLAKADTLRRFPSRDERDGIVEDEAFDGSGFHWLSVTRDEARRYFPHAFTADDPCQVLELWRDDGTWSGAPSGSVYSYM